MSKPFYHFLLSLSFVFLINSHGGFTVALPSPCPESDCGNGVKIRYPFWKNDNATDNPYCGYPQFGLSCSNNEPVLTMPGDRYLVKDINYTDYTITLVDIDVAGQPCPRARHNLSLEGLPLGYTNLNLNLSFYFNCTSNPISFLASEIGCLGFNALKSYVIAVKDEARDVDWDGKCEANVVATVMSTAGVFSDGLVRGFGEAMNRGFVLNWRTFTECGDCERSNGFCGFNDAEPAREYVCFCEDGSMSKRCKGIGEARAIIKKTVIGAVVGITGILMSCGLICYYFKRTSPGFLRKNQDFEAFLINHGPLAIKRYNYAQLKKMTHLFKEKLGQGGYGTVYKGKLFDGHFVAVKMLNESKGEEEFINEIATISRTRHVNIVSLLGFCMEGQKRALVYEFMSNGSLDKFICYRSILNTDHHLGWEIMHQIAMGIAQGLEYLHRGCNTRIVHFDIKPHNILLSEDFCPKISDFGLAKLCTRRESIISMLEVRGTIGYIAPEIFSRNFGQVSYKSDVYSYGMIILDIVGGREKNEMASNSCSETYFPHWLYRSVEQGNESQLHGDLSAEETEIVRKLTLIGLLCIQNNPSDRPSMNKVIEMLQGTSQTLKIPPKPFLSSPQRFTVCSSTLSLTH